VRSSPSWVTRYLATLCSSYGLLTHLVQYDGAKGTPKITAEVSKDQVKYMYAAGLGDFFKHCEVDVEGEESEDEDEKK
jgi:hypothetical protein